VFGRVVIPPPYDFELSCRDEGAFWKGREYDRLVRWFGGPPRRLRLKSAGVVERPLIEWRLEGMAPGIAANADVSARVHALLGGADDLAACYAAFERDPVLAALGRQLYGLRLLRAPSVADALFERHPNLSSIARAEAAGELTSDALHTLGAEKACLRLMSLPGVGRQAAEAVLLHGLGYTDALPADDIRLRRSVEHLYALRAPVTALALRRRWRPLAPWRGYAALYAMRAPRR